MRRVIAPLQYLIVLGLTACSAVGLPSTPVESRSTFQPDASSEIPLTPTPFPPPEETGEIEGTAPLTPTVEFTPSPFPSFTAEPSTERIKYDFSVQVDFPRHQVAVEETITIPHPGQVILEEIVLVVPPRDWQGVFTLEDVSDGEGQPLRGYELERVKLRVPLEEPWLPGETQTLQLAYRLDLPIQNAREGYGPSPFGYTSLQTNLVDWYPMVPPYQEGLGWVVHEPWIFGEYLVYPAADYDVSLLVTGGGEVVVAASAPDTLEANLRRYHLDEARNVVFSLSPAYQVLEKQAAGTTLRAYVFPAYRESGKAALETTAAALELYQELYGPYRQASLTLIQADFYHSMEFEGAYFLSRGFFDSWEGGARNFLTLIAAHETAHQWWYGRVGSDQALHPWMDEALCTFSELVFYETYHPDAVSWWWEARVDYYQPEGVIDRSIYEFTGLGDNYLAYRDSTYLQGARFMARLREAVGTEDFFAFLRDYAEAYDSDLASPEGFFDLLGEYHDLSDLDWLGEYFSEHPLRGPG